MVTIEQIMFSHQRAVRAAASAKGFDINGVAVTEGDDYSLKPVQIVFNNNLDEEVRSMIKSGLENMSFCGLDYKLIEDKNGELL